MAYDYIARKTSNRNTGLNAVKGNLDISEFFDYEASRTSNGYQYTWSDKNTCAITGTSGSSASFANFLQYLYTLPEFMPEGSKFEMDVKLPAGVYIETNFYMNDNSVIKYRARTSGVYKIAVPYGTKYNVMRIYIPTSTVSVNGTVKIYMHSLNEKAILTENELTFNDKTQNGITFAWQSAPSNPAWGVGRTCDVSGESSGLSFDVIYNQSISATRFVPGNTYYIDFNNTDKNIGIEFTYTTPYGNTSEIHWTPGYFTIPESATNIIIRLRVNQYFTVDGSVSNISVSEGVIESWKPIKMISFIDDDTSSVEYCEKYYNNCKHNQIPGNFAVMGYRINGSDTLKQNLLTYEEDGFGMLVHAYNQNDERGQWQPETYNAKYAYEDMCEAVRIMNEAGFTDFKHWVVPGGHMFYGNDLIARRLGMKSAISTADRGYNSFDKFNKLYVKRIALNANDTNSEKSLAYVKSIIDQFMADFSNGWLIIATHFNEWDDLTWNSTLDANGYPVGYARFNEIVQYAITAGCDPVQYQEGYSYAVT